MKRITLLFIMVLLVTIGYSQRVSRTSYGVALTATNDVLVTLELDKTEMFIKQRDIWRGKVINEFQIDEKFEYNNNDNLMVVDPTSKLVAIAINDVNKDTDRIVIYKLSKEKRSELIDIKELLGDVYTSQVLFLKFNEDGTKLYFASRDRSFVFNIKKNKVEELMPNEELALIEYDYRNSTLYYVNINKVYGGGAKLLENKGYVLVTGETRKYSNMMNYTDHVNRMTGRSFKEKFNTPNLSSVGTNYGDGVYLISDDNKWVVNKTGTNLFIYTVTQQ